MSSVRIDASGQRALSSTINGPDATSAQIPTKGDDNVNVQLGNLSGFSMVLPLNARLRRVQTKGGGQYLLLDTPDKSAASLSIYSQQEKRDEGVVGMYPHATVSVGKHLVNPYAAGGSFELEEVEVIHERLGDLIPPTEG